jgi:hypothetical protein
MKYSELKEIYSDVDDETLKTGIQFVEDEMKFSFNSTETRRIAKYLLRFFIEGVKIKSNNTYTQADINSLFDFIESIKRNWDCDVDSHRYNTHCRACEAESILKKFNRIEK